jgi:hypothetical protein
MIEVILHNDIKNTIPLKQIPFNRTIFAKKDKIIKGLVKCKDKNNTGWTLVTSNVRDNFFIKREDCITYYSNKGYKFFIQDNSKENKNEIIEYEITTEEEYKHKILLEDVMEGTPIFVKMTTGFNDKFIGMIIELKEPDIQRWVVLIRGYKPLIYCSVTKVIEVFENKAYKFFIEDF